MLSCSRTAGDAWSDRPRFSRGALLAPRILSRGRRSAEDDWPRPQLICWPWAWEVTDGINKTPFIGTFPGWSDDGRPRRKEVSCVGWEDNQGRQSRPWSPVSGLPARSLPSLFPQSLNSRTNSRSRKFGFPLFANPLDPWFGSSETKATVTGCIAQFLRTRSEKGH